MVANQESEAASAASPAAVDPMRLASRWRSPAEWEAAAAELEADPAPSELNTVNSSGLFAVVSPDKMSVRYLGSNHHGHDVGVVQANRPAPTRRAVYYFEMGVRNAGHKGQISIGFTCESFKMRRQPGWESNSCGYHGDDGFLYRGHGKGESFGPKFTSGDTIGAGINYMSQEFFFTKNGSLVGAFPKEIKVPLYPSIAVHSQDEEATVNFGKEQFCFDIEGYILEEKMRQQLMADKMFLQPDISHWIVRSYLLHYGYQDTLNSFDMASETDPPANHQNGYGEPPEMYGLSHRKRLRQLIMSGDIDSTFKRLVEWYPQVIKDEKSVICFLLHSQRFIEYIRAEQLEDAVKYGRANLANFLTHKAFEELLKECVALLAYEKPAESCIGYLLDSAQREFVADAVNAAILSTNPNMKDPESCLYSCLEKLLRQLTVCSFERRAFNNDQGDAFLLHKEVQNSERSRR
ncbi:ran-binding protein M homolog [Phragmites australis]|uniref:ran-binding protein M homolog n=1 Tax=Phragmites australis TaxID=29695 RepID=UPI002D78322E|nr:ran-binding protein M homolog [Phragmites australis]XP_062223088.1 ran-binding protein M homolog [Phragmites australis]